MLKVDLTGQKFERLSVKEFAGRTKHGAAIWRCECKCGKVITALGQDLKSGHTRSCGCLKLEAIRGNQYAVKHGACDHPLFLVWSSMMTRCYNKAHAQYADYGGRGVTVCKRWHDPWKFFEDMGGRPAGGTLERVKNNQGYRRSNCRWASRKEQALNKRNNRLLWFRGEEKPLSQWAEECGISEGTIRERILKLGWPVEKALTTPPRKRKDEPT
jgi:hypothetical protein